MLIGKCSGLGKNLGPKPDIWPRKSPFPFLSLNFIIAEVNSRATTGRPKRRPPVRKMTLRFRRRRRKCNETVPLARPGARPVTAADSTSCGPTATPPAGRESDAPPLALTRHVDAKEDALGRGKLLFRSPGLSEDHQVWKQRRQPGLYWPQRRRRHSLTRRHSGDGSGEIFRRTTGNSVSSRSSQSATTALTGPSHQPISAGFLGAPPTCFQSFCACSGFRGRRGGRRAGRRVRRSKA